MDLRGLILDVPDFPRPGVGFKDITPLVQDPGAFSYVLEQIQAHFSRRDIQVVAAVEARGFVFGAPLALSLNAAFVPIRKKGKLPRKTIEVSYDLEYGNESIEVHEDAISPDTRILIVDDVLATGGTATAARSLLEQLGGDVVGMAFAIELAFLGGRGRLPGVDIFSVVQYG